MATGEFLAWKGSTQPVAGAYPLVSRPTGGDAKS